MGTLTGGWGARGTRLAARIARVEKPGMLLASLAAVPRSAGGPAYGEADGVALADGSGSPLISRSPMALMASNLGIRM